VAQWLLFIVGIVAVAFGIIALLAFVATVVEDRKPTRNYDSTFDNEPTPQVVLTTGVATPTRARLPRRILSAIADLLRLAWTVILTRKWKICPTVTLPL
jgi:hypothetical protein